MVFAERLKMMRAEKGVTQVQLAKDLGFSKGAVAMWETGKREPNFKTLRALSDYFDCCIDFILGKTEDKSSLNMIETGTEQPCKWETAEHFHEMALAYLCLDEYGKNTAEGVICTEANRCREQKSLFPKNDFLLQIKTRRGYKE
jgi:DNA-binding XRE family transcriptional regulator